MNTLNLIRHFESNFLVNQSRYLFNCVHKNVKKFSTNVTDTNQEEIIENNKTVKKVPVEISIKYLTSEAYKSTYGDKFVWEQYRRNHKGAVAPRKTRKTCIRKDIISTGNPCPICRDEFLVLHHKNLELLIQFISPHSGEVLSYSKTGICQKKHQELLVAVERAMDYGLLTFDVPIRKFDYSEYYPEEKKTN